ncbi:hypothetical protein B0T16DRAFT_425872 [Cercophora newfieldiana]|uniref:FAD/NAD(P)-binding domain-containing protein n=1 Tax=Cercophora newfieldiana TaxID=92897 RepID=A0AA39YSE3_9PEZI|nr:hypothetical protein B0T16DRAFT_425872 [Cercophora newfieldiana]
MAILASRARTALRFTSSARRSFVLRTFATATNTTAPNQITPPVPTPSHSHKVVLIGGGTAGLTIAHQLLHTGKFTQDDLAIIDPSPDHHYQPGWTLVGGGLKQREDLRHSLPSLLDSRLKLYSSAVTKLSPGSNSVALTDGSISNYDHLVVVPGIRINYDAIKGLPEALADRESSVSTIYGYETCGKVFKTLEKFQKGQAIFTQPAGVIKCAGAPQKVMWLALDLWKRQGVYDPGNSAGSPVKIAFATGLPVMFGVPKYSAKLEELRQQRGVEGLFGHDLVEVNGDKAVFSNNGEKLERRFDLLHVVPKMGPHPWLKASEVADAAGFVDVDQGTTRHKKFHNVWSVGDASNLPTSKTAAAITAQAPVLVQNLVDAMEGRELKAEYDGYTSCPLTTEYGKVLLAEFMYGGLPKETFGDWLGIDQIEPRRAFYHLKKDFFPWVYANYMVKGSWGGPKGWIN